MQLSESEMEIFSSTLLDSSQNIRARLEKEPKRDTLLFLLLLHLYY